VDLGAPLTRAGAAVRRAVDRASDVELATWIGAALLVAVATPLLFVRQPPYQDLSGHLATITILEHAREYPEFVFNGFLKTNSALTTFAAGLAPLIGVREAGRLFVLLVLATGAFVLPRFVLHFGGRARMLAASLCMPPFVHNWFVSMGMLNYALGLSLAMLTLVALDRRRVTPTARNGAAVVLLSLATWYAHESPLAILELLVGVHVLGRVTWRERLSAARALLPPLVPATALALYAGLVQLRGADPHAVLGDSIEFPTPLWLVYDLWAHWGYGYTPLSATSLVLLATLAAGAVRRAREPLPFFGPAGALALLVVYLLAPYYTVALYYAGSRVIAFLWMAALLRMPEHLPRWLVGALAACAALYVAAMAVDDVRLAGEQEELAAGARAVPEGTRLDVFVFSPRVTSKNTWSLATSWGEYVVERRAHTWEVWADSPMMPLSWTQRPPARLEPRLHHRFMETMGTERAFCAARESMGLDPRACDAQWRAQWAAYWRGVDPYVDGLLMWDPPPDALAQVPAAWRVSFHQGRLWIYAREPAAAP
jgi:hypothetical protein